MPLYTPNGSVATTRRTRASRLPELMAFDADIRQRYTVHRRLIGVDEVGRGSLIGPVVAAAVVLPERMDAPVLLGLDDSKKLSARTRMHLAAWLEAHALTAIGQASQQEVETLNVHQASLLAAHRAIIALCEASTPWGDSEDFILLDGRSRLPGLPASAHQAIIKGDGQSACIAAASVVAKHFRDSLVQQLAQEYPHYDWHTNMGYASAGHRRALALYGATPYHRRTFLGRVLTEG
ncbi:MAG: ribonuclease HII [Candidatus Melainabacteria bacterium]|nr:ribonuclease HII [Candidatus Melainabacteria bacterium]